MSLLRTALAATLFGLTLVAAPASAQSDAAIDRTSVVVGSASAVRIVADDDLTTGSITVRGRASSAKEGNAELTNFAIPQYGQTSGGHAD